MGFLFRAAVVIGVIYAVSPLRDPAEPVVPPAARDGIARGAASLAGAAMAYCRQDPAVCLEAAGQAASQKPAPAAAPPAPRRISLSPEPRDRLRPAP
jgi:hypothetical protein